MISLLRKYRKPLFVAVIIIFLGGTFVGLGGYLFTSRDMTESVAVVGSTKIPYSRFLTRVNSYVDALREQGGDVTDELVGEVKRNMLRDMIVDELLLRKADEMGVVVTDEELARDIRSTPAFQAGGAFNDAAYIQAVRSVYHNTPSVYEKQRRRTMRTNKFKQLIFQSAKITPVELKKAYANGNAGSMEGFEEKRKEFERRAQQEKALQLINYYLRQISTQVEVKSFLEQREAGV